MPLVSQSEFAKLCNVSRQNCAKWIKNGLLTSPAIVGRGRDLRIDVELGQKQIRTRRSASQVAAAGINTRLGSAAPSPRPSDDRPPWAAVWLFLREIPMCGAIEAASAGASRELAKALFAGLARNIAFDFRLAFRCEPPPFAPITDDLLTEASEQRNATSP